MMARVKVRIGKFAFPINSMLSWLCSAISKNPLQVFLRLDSGNLSSIRFSNSAIVLMIFAGLRDIMGYTDYRENTETLDLTFTP